MQLYPWQEEALEAWKRNNYRGIVNVVTGAGKTVLALAGAAQLKTFLQAPLRIKIVVPTTALALQWASALKNILPSFGLSPLGLGYYYGIKKDNPRRDYMIYVINSARYALARHILEDSKENCHVLLIADECHHYASPENRKIFDFLHSETDLQKTYHSLGLSATPQVHGYDTILIPSLGREIYHYGFTAAAISKTVCNFSVFQIALSFTAEERSEYEEFSARMSLAYKQITAMYPGLKNIEPFRFFPALRKIVDKEGKGCGSPAEAYLLLSYERKKISNMASARISCVLDLIEQLDSDSRILIFGERILQAEEVFRMLSLKYPNQVGCYHSEMSSQAKKNTLSHYREGRLRILVSCRALDEGLDVPDVTVGIILSGSSVNRQKIQRLGRILRRNAEKDFACMYYLYVQESSEDSAYLPDQEEDFPICNLSYCQADHSFSHPAYEAIAARILEKAREKNMGTEFQKEIRKCLLAGLVRPDWLTEEKECEVRMEKAKNQRERNYWLCMKWMRMEGKC